MVLNPKRFIDTAKIGIHMWNEEREIFGILNNVVTNNWTYYGREIVSNTWCQPVSYEQAGRYLEGLDCEVFC